MNPVSTDDAPAPAGHYSQAIVHAGVVYVAGQLPIDPHARDAAPGSIAQQTERTLRNVEAVLLAAGSDLSHLLSVTVYVTDIEHWPAVNEAYAAVLGDHRPARAVVPVKTLHHDFLIEIQATAAVRDPA